MPSFGSYETRRELAGAGFCARWEASLSPTASAPGAKPFGDRFVATAVGPSVVVPWLPRAGLDEEARRLVGAARDQAQLVGAGAKRWSIVADFGLMDDGRGAFVVRPALAWTVERLVQAEYVLTSVEFRGIILGVVEGMLELERSSGRQWGNLSSATVMLSAGPGDSKLADGSAVSLTELESRERLGTDAHIADLRALGRLIYEMMLHKRPPLKAAAGWTAAWSEGWESIGDGRWWFELANRLMSAGTAIGDVAAPPTLAQVRQMVLEHRPHKPLPKRQLMFAGGIVVFCLVAGGAYFALRPSHVEVAVLTPDQLDEKSRFGKWQRLVDNWMLWFGDVYVSRSAIEAAAAGQPAGSTIHRIVEHLRDPALQDPRVIAGAGDEGNLRELRDSKGDWIQGDKIIAAAASLDKIDEIRRLLIDWPELNGLREMADSWEKRGWGPTVQFLKDEAASVAAAIPTIVVREANSESAAAAAPAERSEQIVATLLGAQKAVALATEAENRWESLQKAAETEKSAGDPVLAHLGQIVTAEVTRALNGPAPGEPALAALVARLKEVDDAAKADLAFERGEVAGWDKPGFRSSPRLSEIAKGEPGLAQLIAWRKEAARSEFARVDAPDPREPALELLKNATETLQSNSERLTSLSQGKHELTMLPAEYEKRAADVRAAAGTLAATAWSNRNRATVEAQSNELRQNVEALIRDLNEAVNTALKSKGEALQGQDREPLTSEALNKEWKSALGRAEAAPTKREAFATIHAARDLLHRLNAAVPERADFPANEQTGTNAAAWRRAAEAARERVIIEAINDGPAGVSAAGPLYEAWIAQAGEYFRLAGAAAALLASGESLFAPDGPDALSAIVAKMEAIPGSADLAPIVPGVTGAIAEIRNIGRSTDRDSLAGLVDAAKPDSAPVALAAWTRLAQIGWPGNAAQVKRAGDLASRVLPALIESGITPGSRATVRERVDEQARQMWVAFMNSRPGSDREGIDAAMSGAGRFGVAALAQAGLGPGARYNALVWTLGREADDYSRRQAQLGVGAKSDAAALAEQTKVAAGFAKRLDDEVARLGVSNAPAVSKLVTALGEIVRRDAKPAFDPLKSGPASLRGPTGHQLWKGAMAGEAVVYTLDLPASKLANGQPIVKLVFLPVSVNGPGGPIATYVGAHEVSVGTFIGAAESQRLADSWKQFGLTLRNWEAGRPDPRPGPAPWTWDTRHAKITLSDRSNGSGWLRGHPTMAGKPYYAPELGEVSPPNFDSPMNWMTPDAALLAARLMGARLPTLEEWKAAVEAAGGAKGASAGANRRDKTWSIQFKYIDGLDVSGKEFPNAAAFWPKNARPQWEQNGRMAYAFWRDGSALAGNDGYLWFAPAARDSLGWSNLIGNVSEIVLDDKGDPMSDVQPKAEVIRPLVEQLTEKWRVVGASALSGITMRDDKEYDPFEAYEFQTLRDARNGYADLGFRLAFSEGGTGRPKDPPAVLAAKAMMQAGYIDAR